MTGVFRFRSGIAGALVAVMLATPLSAASDGNQALLDKQAAEVVATAESLPPEETERRNRIGSGVAGGVAVVAVILFGLFLVGVSQLPAK